MYARIAHLYDHLTVGEEIKSALEFWLSSQNMDSTVKLVDDPYRKNWNDVD